MTGPFALTDHEARFYEENGFVGPFDLCEPTRVAAARRLVDSDLLANESPIYGIRSGRDWHLVSREIYDLCAHPAIVERLAGLLGPDVVLWRTQMFYKKPGDGETLWHQDYSFPGPLNAPSIDPPLTVTAWIALDEATIENGCVELVAGTHRDGRLATVADETGNGIFGRNYRLEREVGPSDRIVKMTIEPGQFFLFSNLLVHGSGPNLSDRTRLGIGARFAPASVRVYPGLSIDGQGMSLERYGCVLVRGEDRYGHNRMVPPPEAGAAREVAASQPARDVGFKMGYGFGYAKGERHAAKGVRVDIASRAVLTPAMRGKIAEYGDPDELAAGFREGVTAGYEAALGGRPFDTRYGTPAKLPGRGRGPARRVLRLLGKLTKRF